MVDPHSPEVEARIECPVALLLVQPSEGVFGKAALHEPVQVAVPFDQDADDAPLWSSEEKKNFTNLEGVSKAENFQWWKKN